MNPVLLWFHQLGSPPTFARFAARWTPWGFGLGLVGMAIGLYGALLVVPADYQQGDSFRILYIHVPAAWMSLFVYGLMAVYAAIALIWRKNRYQSPLVRRFVAFLKSELGKQA